jgi:hypothetical protein
VEAFYRISFEKIAECAEKHTVELTIFSRVDSRNMVNNKMFTKLCISDCAVKARGASTAQVSK